MKMDELCRGNQHYKLSYFALALAILASAEKEYDADFFNSNWYRFINDRVKEIRDDLDSTGDRYKNHSIIKV